VSRRMKWGHVIDTHRRDTRRLLNVAEMVGVVTSSLLQGCEYSAASR
jgi:hypothetical protein